MGSGHILTVCSFLLLFPFCDSIGGGGGGGGWC